MSTTRNLRWLGRLARIAAVGGVAALVAFHGWLFAGRLSGGELLEPAVALRWLASLFLVGALLTLRGAGVPLIRGRRALVLWVAVLLLHWNATPLAEHGVETGEFLIAAPGALTLAASVAGLVVCARRLRQVRQARHGAAVPVASFSPPTAAWLLLALAPRPPPA